MCKNSNLLTGLWLEEVEHNVPSGLMTLSRKKCYLSFFPALPGASEFLVQHLTVKDRQVSGGSFCISSRAARYSCV